MNHGIFGAARARGGSPDRPIATRAEAYAGTDRRAVITPETMHLSRRGTGRAWFWELFHDFAMAASSQNIGTDGCLWFNQSSGTGSSIDNTTFGYRPDSFPGRMAAGLMVMLTGTTSTGRGGFDSTVGVSTHRFDTGTTFMETLVYLPNLADATDDFVFRVGYCFGTGLQNDQMGFEYNRSNSTNWVGLSSYNGNHTRFDTGIAVSAAQWVRLRGLWDANTVQWQVNDFPIVGGSTSNIRPDGSGRLGAHIIKTAGTTTRAVVLDYVYFRHDFTSERTYT